MTIKGTLTYATDGKFSSANTLSALAGEMVAAFTSGGTYAIIDADRIQQTVTDVKVTSVMAAGKDVLDTSALRKQLEASAGQTSVLNVVIAENALTLDVAGSPTTNCTR